MKRTIVAILASVLLLGAVPALAQGPYGPGPHGPGPFGPGPFGPGPHGHHHDHGAAIAGALVGGVVLGHLLTPPPPPPYPYPYPPPGPALGNCLPTSGVGILNGRRAEFAGTMCYDAFGNGYVLPQSQRFIRYLP